MAVCTATKADGSPCRAQALAGGEFCMFHSPERAAQVAAIRRAGGLNRRTSRAAGTTYPATLRTVQSVQELLEAALQDTAQQENSGSRTAALARLASTALKSIEVGELEQRLAAIELRLALREGVVVDAEQNAFGEG